MLRTIFKKRPTQFLTSRLIFQSIDAEGIAAYDRLQEANKDAAKLVDSKINNALKGVNIKPVKDEMDTKATEAKTEIDKRAKAEIGKLSAPTFTPTTDPVELQKQAAAKTEYDQKCYQINTKSEALKVQCDTLAATAKEKIQQAFDAKIKALDNAILETAQALAGKNDPEDKKELAERSEFANDLADDGAISSLFADEVRDYLNSEIIIDGKVVPLNDSDVESIAMGIAAMKHDKSVSKKEEDPARIFIKGLSDQEREDTRLDTGVDIDNVKLQVLRTIKLPMGDRDARKEAYNSPVSKLFDKIAADQTLAPELRGMLIAELTNANPETINKVCSETESMLSMIKVTQNGTSDKIGSYSTGSGWLESAAEMQGGAMVGGPLGALIGAGVAAWRSGKRDENALNKAGAVFYALKDAQKQREVESVAGEYKAFSALSGIKDPKLEKDLADLSAHPSTAKKLTEIHKEIEKAQAAYRTQEITKLKAEAASKAQVYEYFGKKAEFSVAEKEIAALDSKKDISEFKSGIASLQKQIELSAASPILISAAELRKDQANKAIDEIKAYEAKAAKYKNIPKVRGLSALSMSYANTSINTGKPEEIKTQLASLTGLGNDIALAKANSQAIDQILAEAAKNSRNKVKETPQVATPVIEGAAFRPTAVAYNEKPLQKLPDYITSGLVDDVKKQTTPYTIVKFGDNNIEYLVERDKTDGAKLNWYERKSS